MPDLSQIRWKFAKTYPDAPHEYVTIWQYPEIFPIVRDLIKAQGVNEKFTLRGKTSTYRYYYEGEYKYWIIGQILKRAKMHP
jgi:hypothetical protein